jgi:hypothetical protein
MSIWKYFSVRWIFWLFRFAVEYKVVVVGVWMSRFVLAFNGMKAGSYDREKSWKFFKPPVAGRDPLRLTKSAFSSIKHKLCTLV